MKDQDAVRYNEQLKLAAQTFTAAGAALTGWALVKIWDTQNLMQEAGVWLVVGTAAIVLAIRGLGLLRPEE